MRQKHPVVCNGYKSQQILYRRDYGLLRIIGSVRTGSKTDLKPVLTAKISGGLIQLFFTRQGAYGLAIFSKLPGEEKFSPLDTAVGSPYTDPRPAAEKPNTKTI